MMTAVVIRASAPHGQFRFACGDLSGREREHEEHPLSRPVHAQRRTGAQSDFRDLLDYDPETGAFTWRARSASIGEVADWRWKIWNAKFAGKPAGRINRKGYRQIAIDKKGYSAHRLAWYFVHGVWPSGEVDHINHDRADNRIANLRDCSHDENQRNKKRLSTNTSGITGVRFCPAKAKWIAFISIQGRRKTLGTFVTKGDAVAARINAQSDVGYHANHGGA